MREDKLAVELLAIVADVEAQMPGLREHDPLSDWNLGVVWMLDRLRNIAADRSPSTCRCGHPERKRYTHRVGAPCIKQ